MNMLMQKRMTKEPRKKGRNKEKIGNNEKIVEEKKKTKR